MTDPDQERVVTIPQKSFGKRRYIDRSILPFTLKVHHFGVNCDFDFVAPGTPKSKIAEIVNRGVGQSANLNITDKDEDFSGDAMNFGYLVFELTDQGKSLGNWMTISHPAGNHVWSQISPKLADLSFQSIRHNGKLWGITLRQKREYLPFSIELLDIEHEYYQGTEIPFNFESDIKSTPRWKSNTPGISLHEYPAAPWREDLLPVPNE